MSSAVHPSSGAAVLAEMWEFARHEKGTQRYIRRSLDVGLNRRDAIRRWSRSPAETAAIRMQSRFYARLDQVRAMLPSQPDLEAGEAMLGPLIAMTAFDLASGKLPSFDAYRFLYERLVGARVRPWLPGAFCAAASLPHLHPDARRALLSSISTAAAGAAAWSEQEPRFIPEWVEKVERPLAYRA